MSEISELEGRITAALDRISRGVDGLSGGAGDTAEVERLTQALEEERTTSAQLLERVKVLRRKLDEQVATLGTALDEAREAVTAMDTELQQLRDVNDQLRESNVALRDANAAGLADADLINAAMMAELDALRATRAADAAEMGAVLTQLDAILDGAKEENA